MPKKRFTTQYSKPRSTVHPSLSSTTGSASLGSHSDGRPTVNELISSLRKSTISSIPTSSPNIVSTPTLPPNLRHLLSQPETPIPRPRIGDRRRFDASGRRLPAGPAPPQSWRDRGSRIAPTGLSNRSQYRVYPSDVGHLPGLEAGMGKGRSLRDTCLRNMAREWEYLREYERYNLADTPSTLRMALLSTISVYGPFDGVDFEGLRSILVLPTDTGDIDHEEISQDEYTIEERNDSFFRLDLSGAIGHSLTFKDLTSLVRKPSREQETEPDLSWEERISRSLSPPIPLLTHLSLSHPSRNISWKSLLAFTKHVPTLTHLSLAFWPVPSLTPNAKTTVMSSPHGSDVQYGATNYYSHSLDNDYRETAEILKKLATRLYGLKYLDLTGCGPWIQALYWVGKGDETGRNIDWGTQWVKLHTLKVCSGLTLTELSPPTDLILFQQAYTRAISLHTHLISLQTSPSSHSPASKKRKVWIDVVRDDWKQYTHMWQGSRETDVHNRNVIRELEMVDREMLGRVAGMRRDGEEGEEREGRDVGGEEDRDVARAERLSVWDQ